MARSFMVLMAGGGIATAIGFVFFLSSLGGFVLPHGASPLMPSIQGGPTIFSSGNYSEGTFALASTQTLKKFSSIEELQKFLEQSIVAREISNGNTGIRNLLWSRRLTVSFDS